MKHVLFLLLTVISAPVSYILAQSINTNLSVGTPEGHFAVSQTGGATYTIPIETPQGLRGMQPRLAIAYNSLSGNGLAGWGCGLSGISAITRGMRDVYHDGQGDGLSFTNADAFYLDGQRLILQETATDSIVYCPESDPYTTVVMRNASSATSAYFTVHTRDGLTHTYSHKLAYWYSGVAKVQAWYITSSENMVDGTSNSVSYSYSEDSYYVYPDSITYGRPAGGHRTGKVAFTYESRPDEQRFPLLQRYGIMKKRLKTVTTSALAGSQWHTYRTYTLGYNSGQADGSTTGFSRLTAVSVANGNGESMNPIALQWNCLPSFSTNTGGHSIQLAQSSTQFTFSDFSLMSADINGDGLSDIIQHAFVSEAINGHREYRNFYNVHLVSKNSDGTLTASFPRMCKFPPDIQSSGMWTYQRNTPLVGDFDGDGCADLFLPYLYDSSDGANAELFYLLGKDAINGGIFTDYMVYGLRNSSETPLYVLNDFDLDGCSDIVLMERAGSGGSYDLHLYGGRHDFSSSTASEYHATLSLPYPPKKLFSSDYDGDGRADLMVLMQNSYKIFWNTGGALSAGTFTSSGSRQGYVLKDNAIVREGDFNGDGIADFLTNAANSGQWYFHLGNSNGLFTQSLACTLDVYEQSITGKDDDCFTCLVYDMDGDGKSDVLISKAMYSGSSFSKTKTYWLTSNGTTLTQLSYSTSDRRENAMPRYYTAGDFSGNGLCGLLHYGYDCYSATDANADSELYLFRNPSWGAGTGRVSTVTDGLGSKTQISYKPLTDASVYTYTYQGSNTPPLLTVKAPLAVVSAVKADNGAAGRTTEHYTYKDLQVHSQGRGLLGFKTTTVSNQNTNVTTTTTIQRDPVTLLPMRSETTQAIGGATACTTSTYLTHFHHNTRALYSTLLSTVATDLDQNTTTTTYVNDSTRSNVPLSVTVQGFDGARVTTTYGGYTQRGRCCLPQTVTESRRHPDHSADFVTTTTYEYNAQGQKTKEVTHADTPQALTTTYSYNLSQNLKKATTSGADIENVFRQYEYDSTQRFVTKKTERGYMVEEYVHDEWGNIVSSTDKTRTARPLVTAYSYDGWGRLTGTRHPSGQRDTCTMAWGSSYMMRYSVYTKSTGQPWVRTWYDNACREVRRESAGPKGLARQEDITYDSRGLPIRKVSRHGLVAVTGVMTYDTRGRLLTDTDDLGKSLTYTYGANSVTTTDHGRNHTKTYDSWGNVKRSSDPAAFVTYKYHSCGSPKSATSAGSTVTMQYDGAGNRTRLDDPDAGTMTYTYDALGRIKTQTDGNGITTTNTYNTYGQLAQSTTGTVATTYTYGSTTADKGLLTAMSRDGFTETYAYDACGRIAQQSRSYGTPGTRTTTYGYDSEGMLTSRTFPGQLQVRYEYDGNGFLERMTSGGVTLYEVQSYVTPNPTCFYSTYTLGGSMTRYRECDRAGRLVNSAAVHGASFIAPQMYTYDETTGNMESRTFDGVTYEHFTYDALDRLTRAEIDDSTTTYLVYDTNGNIDVKHGTGQQIGSYYYDSSRPHAVTDIENPTGPVALPSWTVDVTYNELGKAATVTDNSQYPATTAYQYGPDGQRWRSSTHLYFGDYEERYVSSSVRRSYIYLDGGVLAVANNGGTYAFYYIHTDHQGSVLAVTDASGNHVFKATYDPWGRQTVEQNTIAFYRGYTGHEMLRQGGLVNMNGRIYDPAIGRFLSPDNYVQMPDNSQNFNRYSYCLNNPLKYTDPSGEYLHLVIGAIIGGTINWTMNGCKFNTKGLGYFGVGAIAGALGAGISGGISSSLSIAGQTSGGFTAGFLGTSTATTAASSFVSGALIGGGAGLSSGFVAGMGNALVDGKNIGKSLANGGINALIGGVSGAVIGGLFGGFDALSDGRRFWDGATVEQNWICQDIPIVGQNGNYNCAPASAEAVDKSFGGKLRQEDIRNYLGGNANETGLYDTDVWNTYHNMTGKTVCVDRSVITSTSDVIHHMANGERVSLNLNIGGDVGHSVVVQKIGYKIVTKINGDVTHKLLIRIMDPSNGGFYRTISTYDISRAYHVFYIQP